MTELEKLATDAVANVGRLTDDKVKLVKLLGEAVENTRRAHGQTSRCIFQLIVVQLLWPALLIMAVTNTS